MFNKLLFHHTNRNDFSCLLNLSFSLTDSDNTFPSQKYNTLQELLNVASFENLGILANKLFMICKSLNFCLLEPYSLKKDNKSCQLIQSLNLSIHMNNGFTSIIHFFTTNAAQCLNSYPCNYLDLLRT